MKQQNQMTVYLAGKITGDPHYIEKFNAAARKLEEEGYIVLSPAILPPKGFAYAAYIRMSGRLMDECAAVCFLPDWVDSAGAKHEYARARRNRQSIFFYADFLRGCGIGADAE